MEMEKNFGLEQSRVEGPHRFYLNQSSTKSQCSQQQQRSKGGCKSQCSNSMSEISNNILYETKLLETAIQKLNQDLKNKQNYALRQAQIRKILRKLHILSYLGEGLQIKVPLHLQKQELNFLFIQCTWKKKLNLIQQILSEFRDPNQTFDKQQHDFQLNFSSKKLKQTCILEDKELSILLLSCAYTSRLYRQKIFENIQSHLSTFQNIISSDQFQEKISQEVGRYILEDNFSFRTNRDFVILTIELYLGKITFNYYKEKVLLNFQSYKIHSKGREIQQKINKIQTLKRTSSVSKSHFYQLPCEKLSDIDLCSYSLEQQSFYNQLQQREDQELKQVRLKVKTEYHRFLKRYQVTSMQQDFGNYGYSNNQNESNILSRLEQSSLTWQDSYLNSLLQCFSFKQSYLKYFSFQAFLKEDWSLIKMLDFSNSNLKNQQLKKILEGNWSHLLGFIAFNNQLTTLENCNLHLLTNAFFMSFAYNILDKKSVNYLLQHQWANLIQFRVSFIDGDESWPLLMSSFRKCFPNLRYLGVREALSLSSTTKQFIKSFEGLDQPLQIGFWQ